MKKYIAPAAQIVNLAAENLIAMSLQTGTSLPQNQLSNKFVEEDWEDWNDEE